MKNYDSLKNILDLALKQASEGKGKERHANDKGFTEQPIFWIEEHFKSFQLGQAVKKIHESQSLPVERAGLELLGAINYLAAHYIHLEPKKTLFEKHKKLTTKEVKVMALRSDENVKKQLDEIVNPEFVDG
jgi:hypothetical protein